MHRTQILLEDAQYVRLREQSETTGTAIGELVRRAVDQVYGLRSTQDRLRALDESFGAATGQDFDGLDGVEWVEQQRRGLDSRFGELDRT
jgi:hypothetical protein